jgi:hypothetical protein
MADDEQQEEEPQDIQPGQQLQMVQPQMLPEIVHALEWADPDGQSGICLLISSPGGQEYHYWPHKMGLSIASNIQQTCRKSPGIIPVASGLVLPPGARA